VDTVTQKRQRVKCEVMTDSEQTVEGISGKSDTRIKEGTVLGTDRECIDGIRQRWI
jgi:hypothetical protein